MVEKHTLRTEARSAHAANAHMGSGVAERAILHERMVIMLKKKVHMLISAVNIVENAALIAVAVMPNAPILKRSALRTKPKARNGANNVKRSAKPKTERRSKRTICA